MRRIYSILTAIAAAVIAIAAAACVPVSAETLSYTGTLSNPEDTVQIDLMLTTSGSVALQTYEFGGGTNAAGTAIASGGLTPSLGFSPGQGRAPSSSMALPMSSRTIPQAVLPPEPSQSEASPVSAAT